MNDFCDLLGTPDAPVSKIAPVKVYLLSSIQQMHIALSIQSCLQRNSFLLFSLYITLKIEEKSMAKSNVTLAIIQNKFTKIPKNLLAGRS